MGDHVDTSLINKLPVTKADVSSNKFILYFSDRLS